MKPVSQSRWQSLFRPHIEGLEDRFQPSNLQTGVAGLALTPLAQVAAVSHQAEPHTNGPPPPAAIDYGTFVTGTAGTATGRAITVDASDNQYVTGGVDDGTGEASYIKKYLPDGTPDPTVPAVTLRVVFNGVIYNTEGHGIAVDPTTGNIELVGTASDPASGNQLAFFAQYDPTGTLFNLEVYGNDPNPNSFDGVTVDAAGDVAFTGTVSIPTAGHSELVVGALPVGGSSIVLPFDLGAAGNGAGLGIAIDGAGMTAYIAGSAAATPGGPQQGVLAWIDRHNPTVINFDLLPDAAGDVVANSVAVNSAGVYFNVMLPSVAAVVQLDPTLTTFLSEYDFTDPNLTVAALALDAAGNVYVTGQSLNPDTGNLTAQLTQLDGSLNLVGTVQIGGTGTDAGLALAVKSNGTVVVAGTTDSADFPATDGTTLNGTTDAFLVSYSFPC